MSAVITREISSEHVGHLASDEGVDHYYIVRSKDGEPLSCVEAHDFLLPLVYRECRGPGTVFCDRVRTAAFNDTEVMCIAEVHRDT